MQISKAKVEQRIQDSVVGMKCKSLEAKVEQRIQENVVGMKMIWNMQNLGRKSRAKNTKQCRRNKRKLSIVRSSEKLKSLIKYIVVYLVGYRSYLHLNVEMCFDGKKTTLYCCIFFSCAERSTEARRKYGKALERGEGGYLRQVSEREVL
jgi:hypothetical protein